MSLEKVKEYFNQYEMADRILEFEESSASVADAANALNTEPERIAKSLTFLVDEKPIMILMAGDRKVANRKFKDQFHARARMMKPQEVAEFIGHEIGGVCPFGIPNSVAVYLDDSLKQYETVFPAAGNGKSAIELTIPELEKYSQSQAWIDISQ